MHHFLTLKDYFIEYKWRYVFGFTWLLTVDVMQLFVPRILGNVTDAIQENRIAAGGLALYAALIIGIAVVIAIFRLLWRTYINGVARALERWLRNRLFSHLLTLSPGFYNYHKTGDLMALATNDITAVRAALGIGLAMSIDAIVLTTAAMTIMASIHPGLTLLAMLPLPFVVLTVTRFGRSIHSRFKQVQEAFGRLTGRVQENIAGIRVIQAFAQEGTETTKFLQAASDTLQKNMLLARISGLFFPFVQFLASTSLLVSLGYGGTLVIENRMSLGDFVAFNSYLVMLTWPAMATGWVINMMQRGAASMARINAILNTEPEIIDRGSVENNFQVQGHLEFQNLSYRYPASACSALTGISIRVEAGQTMAILGRTGSGKSTLVNLILRLYDPPAGCLFLDGYEIHRIPLYVLRDQIGYVPQDTLLFSTSCRENIALAGDDFTEEQIIAAARLAHIHEEIQAFPEGYGTIVGERGLTLSGGQKQRIAIARAIIKDPRLLILDDSLSAVDARTEKLILQDLRHLRHDRTTIIISSRVSSIQDADLIVVIDRGRVLEQGKHHDLLALKGLYFHLARKQRLEEEIDCRRGTTEDE